jgi:hypothetical protein
MGIAGGDHHRRKSGSSGGEPPCAPRSRHECPAGRSGHYQPRHYVPSYSGAGFQGKTGEQNSIAGTPGGVQLGQAV